MSPKPQQKLVAKAAGRHNPSALGKMLSELKEQGVTVRPATDRPTTQIKAFYPERPGYGKLDKIISAALDDPSNPLNRSANTMMNPGHEGNVARALPLPDGTPGLVYLHKSVYRGEIEISAGANDSSFRIIAVPSPEHPYALNFSNNTIIAMTDPEFLTYGGTVCEPATWLHKNGVYAHRCIGKSITLDQQTVLVNRSGNITACQLQALWDNDTPSQSQPSPVTNVTNYRKLQNIPSNTTEASRNFQSTNWDADNGIYMPAQFETLNFKYRNNPWEKTSNLLPDIPDAAARCDSIGVTDFSGAPKKIMMPNNTNTAVSKYGNGMPTAYECHGHIDNTSTGCIYVEGLSNGNTVQFKFKICIVREFLLKANSPLLKMAIPRPPMNIDFMQLLVNYTASLPGMYPANYNFWNELWNGFKKVLGKASNLLPMLSPAIKAIAPEASGVMNVVDKINGVVNPYMKNW